MTAIEPFFDELAFKSPDWQVVQLDERCKHCYTLPEIRQESCTFCDGIGYVLTNNGRTLKNFLERHLNIK